MAIPTICPIAAVKPIANTPQNVTRSTALTGRAPPTRAPTAPSSARNAIEVMATTGKTNAVGAKRTIESGRAAPIVKVAAEARAACTGRAVLIAEMPSSSRLCAPMRRVPSAAWRRLKQSQAKHRAQYRFAPVQHVRNRDRLRVQGVRARYRRTLCRIAN